MAGTKRVRKIAMGGISEANVEWAVVSRLKAMLDEPPSTRFNVTQSFALFSTVVMWTKNRAWVRDDQLGVVDEAARAARKRLRAARICEEPWFLPTIQPQIGLVKPEGLSTSDGVRINADFDADTAEDFFKWLRDALAHGDGRNIKPIHKRSRQEPSTLLAGFEISSSRPKRRILSLYNADMRRMGSTLADLFCETLSATDQYHDWDQGSSIISEAA